ncbi:hypothetical protein GYMLUDRAFT_230645 [Collybiopsis luxurians FD-317 M1]|uniref:Steroid 5-alpha reductase C-terminal domain-containing protein n=1 Tax=Collybiopsis luxurians FD-317 M1 TaxID=944289 RepID=A0A0D0CL07_9AGAR|nr:hypothetical protein GYMLUDRAFT_230645 [Collybiopsis luxurians FD-317 M1]
MERGSSRSTPVSRGLFVLSRALDLPIQYAILSSRALGAPLINTLGGAPISPTGRPVYLLGTNLGLSPQRAILFGMAVGSFVKQSHWVLAIGQEPISPALAAFVGAFNTLSNSINTLLFTNAATSVLSYPSVGLDETRLPIQTLVGIGMYVLGMGLEWVSEMQRLKFKKNPRNKGRPYTGGLFGLARHINYGGYVLWRAGFATAAAGWLWGAAVAGFLTFYFTKRAIPELDEYCGKRYGVEWVQYKRSVPSKLLPFIL